MTAREGRSSQKSKCYHGRIEYSILIGWLNNVNCQHFPAAYLQSHAEKFSARHYSSPLGEAAGYISNAGAGGSFTFSGTFHLEGRGYSGGGLIWCFDALFEDGQHKVVKACVMCLHWGTWKESPGPRARGECCRWIWRPLQSRTVAPLMPHNPFSMTFIILKSATPPQHHVWLNLWWI